MPDETGPEGEPKEDSAETEAIYQDFVKEFDSFENHPQAESRRKSIEVSGGSFEEEAKLWAKDGVPIITAGFLELTDLAPDEKRTILADATERMLIDMGRIVGAGVSTEGLKFTNEMIRKLRILRKDPNYKIKWEYSDEGIYNN